MIQISYISSATEPMSTQDLLRLLQGCRENNAGRGVTGMLFYCNGTFLQVLEGEERVIDELLYSQLFMPAIQDFGIREIVVTFGAFLAVLIAIEGIRVKS
jgi:hypothetical protein